MDTREQLLKEIYTLADKLSASEAQEVIGFINELLNRKAIASQEYSQEEFEDTTDDNDNDEELLSSWSNFYQAQDDSPGIEQAFAD